MKEDSGDVKLRQHPSNGVDIGNELFLSTILCKDDKGHRKHRRFGFAGPEVRGSL